MRRTLESARALIVCLGSIRPHLGRLAARVALVGRIHRQQEHQAHRHAATVGRTTTRGAQRVHVLHVHLVSHPRQDQVPAQRALTMVAPQMMAAPQQMIRPLMMQMVALRGSINLQRVRVNRVQLVSTRQRRATQVHHARAAVEAIMQPRRDHQVARHAQLGRGDMFYLNVGLYILREAILPTIIFLKFNGSLYLPSMFLRNTILT